MADPIYTTDDLTVLGGPSSIDVDLDFGATGTRGSLFFVGEGNPNSPSTIIGQTPKILDMYINLHTLDTDYLYLYQYQNVDGQNVWVELVKLLPNQFSASYSKTFTDGSTTINVPIIAIGTLDSPDSSDFAVQASITGASPIAHSVSIGAITFDNDTDLEVLPITINAVEYSDSAWASVDGTKTVHLFITVV